MKLLKNISDEAKTYRSQTIDIGEEFNISGVDEALWAADVDVNTGLLSGHLLAGDGTTWYSGSAGQKYLQSAVATGDTAIIEQSRTPAGPTDNGIKGSICWDADYIYICVATDSWKRVGISDLSW